MAISDSQKVDLLYKKVGFGVAKTDTSTYKSPSNEANASPILTRGDTIWQQSVLLPATIPSSNSSVALVYSDALSCTIECIPDTTSHPVGGVYPTWLTNLQDWIPPSFGATYQVKVYAANAGVNNPQTAGVQLFADGSGNADSWYFDYQSGILNFLDTNIPTPLTSSKHIYIVGARYVGQKGLTNFPAGMTIGNISINGNTISGNTDMILNGNVTISSATNSNDNYSGALHVVGGASITKDLWVGGNVYTNALISENISILSVADPLLYLTANTPYPYNYDIGVFSHFVGGTQNNYQHTGLIRNHNDNYWYFFSNAAEPGGGQVDLANANVVLDSIKAGGLILGNTTISTSYNTGALVVGGGAGFDGNLYLTGNVVSTSTGYFTIPAGTTVQRPNVPTLGMIRYNSTISSYEGYGAGGAWSSLGGVKSVDGHAYITAEAYAAAGDDVLRFYAGDTGVSTQVMWVSNANVTILSNTSSTSSGTGALQVLGGIGVAGNLNTGGNITANAISTDNHLYANGVSIISTLVNTIVAANTAVVSYVNALNTAMTANVTAANLAITGANAAIVSANTAMQNYVDTQISSVNSTLNIDMIGVASNIAGANAAIVSANTAMQNYVNTLNSAMASNVAGANAAIVTANSAVVSYVNTVANSLATGANANTAAYLATYTGNIQSNNFIGNVIADTITPYKTAVTVFNSNTAVGMPTGNTATRPTPVAGYARYNTDTGAIEYYNGSMWISVTNNVVDQIIYADGINNSFALNQPASAAGILVSINGVLQLPAQSYVIDASNNIVFSQVPTDSDIIDVRFLGPLVSSPDTVASDLTVTGNLTIGGILKAPQATKASNATGTIGQVCWDSNYIYVCTATNTWKRSPLTGGY